MKNIFRILMAVAVLFTASCAKEDISSSIGGGEVEVTFTANLQDLGSRAYGDGSEVNTLRFSVYDAVSGEKLTQLCGEKSPISASTPTTVNLVLLKGMKYNITFWADCNKLYNFDGQVVTVDYNNVVANDEERDAFYAYVKEFDPADANADTTIELYRPFAQLNAISTDAADALTNSGVTISKSTVKAELYNSFNLTDGTVSNLAEKTLTAGNILSAELLSMNYLFAPAEGYTPNVTFTFENNKGIDFGASFSYVPLKRNYRTNIIGSLLTKPTDFTVEIEAGFNEPVEVVAADTDGLQAALDAAKDGDVIHLQPNVNYGVVYLGRPTANNNTVMYCENHDFSTTDAEEFKAHLAETGWHTTPRYTTTLKNVTIVGATGATVAGLVATSGHAYGEVYDYVLDVKKSGSGYYNTLNMEDITFSKVAFTGKIDINTSDATSVYNGITFDNCTFTTGGTASSNGAAIRYYNENNNGNVKNIVVNECTFNNCYQGVYTGSVNGVTVTECTFNTTGHNAIAVQSNGVVDLKNVVISGNTFNNIADRIIRFNEVGADSNITITNNTATNSGDENGEVIKATSIAAGVTTSISDNDWGAGTVVVNNELKDPATGVVTVPDNNTQDVVVSAGATEVTVPAAAAQAGDKYKVVVSNENTATDSVTGETTVAFDLTLYKNDVKVSGDVVYAVTKNIGAGLFISEVTHNGTALTKATTGADQTYTYDAATGVLTIYTKTFSPFAVTHSTYKEYIRKLNIAHNINSTINITTGGDLLPIVAVMPEIFGYSVFDGDTRIANAVHFCISNVKKEAINENSYKVAVKVEVKDENGNDLELKSGSPYNTGKEYLNVYMNLIEIPTGYSISNVSVNGNAFTLTQNANGNPSTGEYWLGSDPKDVYIQSKTAGLIEITVAKVN